MKKIGKIASVMLCAAFAAGMLSGCGSVDKESYIAETRSEAEASSAAERITSDGAWKSMAFSLDGKDFVLDRLTLSEIENEGWSFDPATYGMQELAADPLVFYQRSVALLHDGYDEGSFVVGFTNFGEKTCGLDAINIWSVEFASKDVANYPQVTIEGGITWGADEAALKAAYGEPSAAERHDDTGYTQYIYTDNAANVVYLDVYDNGGLGRIIMESYD